eukprot:747433-Hanusia_phi.AAC.1
MGGEERKGEEGERGGEERKGEEGERGEERGGRKERRREEGRRQEARAAGRRFFPFFGAHGRMAGAAQRFNRSELFMCIARRGGEEKS